VAERFEFLRRGLLVLLPLVVLALAGTALFLWSDFFADAVRRFSPGCISRKWLHVYCPGCGGTRAFVALMRGEWLAVLKYNAWWLPTACILAVEYIDWALGKLFPKRDFPLWRKLRIKLLVGYAALTVLYVIARNIWRF
jgi:hypothetical protein